jgi:hypothetical protein
MTDANNRPTQTPTFFKLFIIIQPTASHFLFSAIQVRKHEVRRLYSVDSLSLSLPLSLCLSETHFPITFSQDGINKTPGYEPVESVILILSCVLLTTHTYTDKNTIKFRLLSSATVITCTEFCTAGSANMQSPPSACRNASKQSVRLPVPRNLSEDDSRDLPSRSGACDVTYQRAVSHLLCSTATANDASLLTV